MRLTGLTHRLHRAHRDDRGAVAIIVGVIAMLLFAGAAVAVDLGNAFVRKRDVQAQADFGALAGGAALGVQQSGPVPTAVVDAVRDYLNRNQPQDDDGDPCVATQTCVTSTQLTDTVLANGEVRFSNGGLQVVAPQARVSFGLAAALGYSTAEVQASATVGVFSPVAVMPVYAVLGCDYGNQTITDPAGGHVVDPPVPPLAYDTHQNYTELQSLSTHEVDFQASGVQITVYGRNFRNTTKVGFFRADDTDPALIVEPTSAQYVNPGSAALPYTRNNGSMTVVIPDAVTDVETAWYIRVFEAGTVNKWSERDEAQPLRVGDAVLECASGSSSGNFGTLRMPRTDVPSADDIAMNIADGLQAPLSLAIHAGADASGTCSDGLNGAVVSDDPSPGLRAGTNCVDTDPGLTAGVATQGLIEGVGTEPGRLNVATTAGCDPAGGDAERSISIRSQSYAINNDVLTCFLTDGTTSLAEIASPTYGGGAKLSSAIYDSPRFFFQPVLSVDPSSGSSNLYSIVDFRPAFITDETVSTSTYKGTRTATSDNGLKIENNAVKQMKVVFFNARALPQDDTGQVVNPYLGVGPRILRLID